MGLTLFKIIRNLFIDQKRIEEALCDSDRFEEECDFESSCYSCAIAIHFGGNKSDLKKRIRYLYEKHGPFSFEKQLNQMKEEYCSAGYDSCGEGYHVGIVEIIERSIEE